MSRLETRPESALGKASLDALQGVRISGGVPGVYLQFANSEPALAAYLQMEAALRAGHLSDREVEGIKLLVSQLTGCQFCLSMHTAKARRSGLDAQAQRAIRAGQPVDDLRLQALLELARRLYGTPGVLPDEALASARAAGLGDADLVDLVMAMSTIWFTNLVNHINDTALVLPPAPDLPG